MGCSPSKPVEAKVVKQTLVITNADEKDTIRSTKVQMTDPNSMTENESPQPVEKQESDSISNPRKSEKSSLLGLAPASSTKDSFITTSSSISISKGSQNDSTIPLAGTKTSLPALAEANSTASLALLKGSKTSISKEVESIPEPQRDSNVENTTNPIPEINLPTSDSHQLIGQPSNPISIKQPTSASSASHSLKLHPASKKTTVDSFEILNWASTDYAKRMADPLDVSPPESLESVDLRKWNASKSKELLMVDVSQEIGQEKQHRQWSDKMISNVKPVLSGRGGSAPVLSNLDPSKSLTVGKQIEVEVDQLQEIQTVESKQIVLDEKEASLLRINSSNKLVQ